MKSVRVIRPGELVIAEEPVPELSRPDDLLIRVHAAGICGSDISITDGTSPVAVYPRVIGHEFAGEVVKVGPAVTRFAPGDHVTVNPVMGCGVCRVCRRGRENVCANLRVIGVHEDGGYREYLTVPQKNAFRVPDSLAWSHAAIIEPYTVAAQVAQRGGIEAGDQVLILGCGQIALTILQVCKLLGAECIMTDLVPQRLERARSFGADHLIDAGCEDVPVRVRELTDGIGADCAIDAACAGETLRQAAQAVRPAGVVVTMGFQDRQLPVSELMMTKNELDLRGSRLNNNKFPQVIEWVSRGAIDPGRIITHTLPFTEVLRGMRLVKEEPETTMKVILTFD